MKFEQDINLSHPGLDLNWGLYLDKMTFYYMLKLAHVACVVISGSLFIYKYARLSMYPDQPLGKALKVLPHINDMVLLSCAIGMLSLISLILSRQRGCLRKLWLYSCISCPEQSVCVLCPAPGAKPSAV